jgi:hypothetical protein
LLSPTHSAFKLKFHPSCRRLSSGILLWLTTATFAPSYFQTFPPLHSSFRLRFQPSPVGASGAYRKTLTKNTNSLKLPSRSADLNLATL